MQLDRTPRLLLNFAAFQAGWFACVLSVAQDRAALGIAATAVVLVLHLALARRPRVEAALVAAVVAVGAIWDSLIAWRGLLVYAAAPWGLRVAPLWILAMWALFATTLNVSLNWLKGRTLLAMLLGGVGGPLAYVSGQRLGAVSIPDLWPAVAAQAVGWAVLTPLLTRLAARLDGCSPLPATGVPRDV